VVLRLGDDRLVPSGSFVAAALLDHEAEIHPAPASDVLDGLAGPRTSFSTGDAVEVQELGHLREGVLGQLVPDAVHERRLLRLDHELARVDEIARGVAKAPVAERVVAPVPACLEDVPLDARHALAVEFALQLSGETELAEHVTPGGPIEPGAGQVGHEQGHLATLELVVQVEHESGVAGEAGQVVDDDRRHLARRQRGNEGSIAAPCRGRTRLVPARVGDHPDRRAGRQDRPTCGLLHLVTDVGVVCLLVRPADIDEVLGHGSMNARNRRHRKAHHGADFPTDVSAATSASQSASRSSTSSSVAAIGPRPGRLDAGLRVTAMRGERTPSVGAVLLTCRT